ncbi:MAG TPA: hypothetical protein VFP58_07845 [Candidatus Eisenbacteria bacterium]|nr:hypothetical protein [Candidatus Eisenbacteria bacterium]
MHRSGLAVLVLGWVALAPSHGAVCNEISVSSETPVWSPDGRQIVFSSGAFMQHQIYVMNADGSDTRRLTSGEQNRWPSWSPDGKLIVFMSDRDGQGELYVMNADGTGQRRLTNSPVHEFAPAWSPQGEVLVCLAEMPGAKQQLLIVSVADGSTTRIDGDHLYYGRPAWLPDGSRFLIAAHRDDRATANDRWKVPTRIYSFGLEEGDLRAVTKEGQDTNPWPSPQGDRFVFDTGDGSGWSSDRGQWDLWIFRVRDGQRKRLTTGDANDWGAAWSPDGKRLAFSSGRNRVYALHVVLADGSGRRALTRTDRLPDARKEASKG